MGLVDTDFLDRLAHLLKVDKTAACRRAINRMVVDVKKRFEAGAYIDRAEAEDEFRKLVEDQSTCR